MREAEPILKKAIDGLKTLKVKDFLEMKSYKQPPVPIRLTLEVICITLGLKPKYEEKTVGRGKQKVANYWDQSKKLLSDYKKLLSRLETFNKKSIPMGTDRVRLIEGYLKNPDFRDELIRHASVAAEGLCKWVKANHRYDEVYKEIEPKRIALAEANEKLKIVTEEFDLLISELKRIQSNIDGLEATFRNQNQEKQNLIDSIKDSELKQSRALEVSNKIHRYV